ncbi:phage tail protein I [Fusobacterium animalis]|uniref:phage tail protein I n=1 Tax=Fusobacterium animalis TaxID=76859 RepID=UPI003556CC3D
MSKLMEVNYQDIFPENLKKYKNLKTLSKNFEDIFKKYIIYNIDKLAFIYNLDLLEDRILDKVAYYFNIDDYNNGLDREIKIKLIKSAYWIHSKKGTKEAVISQLKILNYKIDIKEWFEYGGKPFTFRLFTENQNKDKDWLKRVVELIKEYKNVRSILEALYLLKKKEYTYYIAGYKEVFITGKKVNAGTDKEIYKKIFYGGYKQIKKEIIK